MNPMFRHGCVSAIVIAVFAIAGNHPLEAQETSSPPSDFHPLFDGHSLDGWQKADENQDAWKVQDGMLVCHGERCHLFYVGPLAPLKNFHFKAEVMTTAGSNSGIYFHTRYQKTGWPKYGFECQVNVSGHDLKRSGSLYAIENVSDPGVKDDQWYTQEIIVRDKNVVLKINGKTLVDYTEPADQQPYDDKFERLIGEGTFALQAHDPNSKVFFRNLQVKPLDD